MKRVDFHATAEGGIEDLGGETGTTGKWIG